MKMLTVLVVADTERECAGVMGPLAREEDIQIRGPMGGVAALRYCSSHLPSIVLVHARLGDFTGVELCQLLRGRYRTEHLPLIVFDTGDAVGLFDEGGSVDDYLSSNELPDVVRRLRHVIRGASEASSLGLVKTYEGRHLIANFLRVNLLVDGRRVDLTHREVALLRYLVSYRNHVLTRSDILQNVWCAANAGRSRTIDTHIRRLRVKLGPCGGQIQTVPRIGYRFNEL